MFYSKRFNFCLNYFYTKDSLRRIRIRRLKLDTIYMSMFLTLLSTERTKEIQEHSVVFITVTLIVGEEYIIRTPRVGKDPRNEPGLNTMQLKE